MVSMEKFSEQQWGIIRLDLYEEKYTAPATPTYFPVRASASPSRLSFHAFCLCLEFQFSVRLILSIQPSFFRSIGNTDGKGNLLAEIVT